VTRVAFLGLGAMGAPMAGRLLDAGHDLTVWNRTPGRADALVARGAVAVATPADAVVGAEVVVTMVADPPALDQVIEAVAGSIDPGAVLVEMSTVGPTAIRSVAEGLAPVRVLDAPVLGSVPQAEAGSLTILVGGDRDALARCTDVLEAMGRVVHVGPSGAGATVKLANNAAGMSALVALAEVLSFTDRAGLDPETVLDALGMGPLASFVERWRPGVTGATGGRVDFRLVLARKDLALAANEAQQLGVRLQTVRDAIAACDEAIAAGLGEQDNTAVARHVRSADRRG
jgi:3-hydroxyisobutyrate dehydrogenase-like beta-hydroxyacid dehydrogenase